MKLLTFQEALDFVPAGTKPNVLLGNGFSRACRNDIFSYDALFKRADFTALPRSATRAFESLQTTDFEVVMKALRSAALVAQGYDAVPATLPADLVRDADALREVMVKAIADSHPAHPGEIASARYEKCRTFLAHFDCYYTVNYDLLLYWAAMHDDVGPRLHHDDGFRKPGANEDAPYVTWDIQNTNEQNVHYLHGALHVFDAKSELVKFTWKNTQVRLTEQIRTALTENRYPVFVAEGESEQKLIRINHSGFLSRARRSFANCRKPLFIYGHSFAANDDHILRLISDGPVAMIFVSIYGDPHAPENKAIISRAEALRDMRPPRRKTSLLVRFFDASSAHVWD